ncbi:MAG: DUF58 domain-containing protein [Desulfuromonadaceae bacterium]|nr:DUF58 domain-containing protein [Desulfuromonadaceae bacterium]
MSDLSDSSPIRIDLPELIACRQELVQRKRHRSQSRAAVEGGHRSHAKGRGISFAEVRGYQPGDDVRLIDWRVTARTGKAHTKIFDEERERPVLVALDYRRPMFFATRGCFKVVQASRLAALLGWQTLCHNDRFGAFLFSEERTLGLRPHLGKSAVLRVLREMVTDPVWERDIHQPFEPHQRLEHTLEQMRRVVRPGSFIVVISDFNQWNPTVEKQITLLTRHCDLSLVHCYDPFEAELPPGGGYSLSDGHKHLHLRLDAQTRATYAQGFAAHCAQLKQFCSGRGAAYIPCSTTDSVAACVDQIRPLEPRRR